VCLHAFPEITGAPTASLHPAKRSLRTLLKVLRVFAEFRETFSETRALMPQVMQEIQLEFQHFYFAL
jgi:hypothetical protein